MIQKYTFAKVERNTEHEHTKTANKIYSNQRLASEYAIYLICYS